MTEAEWLVSVANPGVMLDQLRNPSVRSKPSQRKLRLIAVACAKRILARAPGSERDIIARVIAVAERFAEGEVSESEASSIVQAAVPWTWPISIACHACRPDARQGARSAVVSAGKYIGQRRNEDRIAKHVELRIQSELIRCVLGNPFRPVSADPSWLTSDVVALVRGIYDDRAFDRMPILADALQDAGCDNVNVLDHCRDPGEHVRGCWVVDLLLGKG